MAPAAGTGDKNTAGLAQSRKLHQGTVGRRDCQGSNGERAITEAERQRIRELYDAIGNGQEVARRMGLGSTTVYKYLALSICTHPIWSDEEIQVMVDGYLEKTPVREIARKVGRSPRAVMVKMCRYRKEVRKDPKKRRVLSAISLALKAVRKADIFREMEA